MSNEDLYSLERYLENAISINRKACEYLISIINQDYNEFQLFVKTIKWSSEQLEYNGTQLLFNLLANHGLKNIIMYKSDSNVFINVSKEELNNYITLLKLKGNIN